MTAPNDGDLPQFATEIPSSARMYDYCLGGRDNFEVDRAAVLGSIAHFPWGVDEARGNRQFLYRVVRYLAQDAGISQFLDLGSGLPTQNNVHQVAQQFQPDATVVYVDIDPIVLTHARALLATDGRTTVIEADMTRPKEALEHPETQRLLDFSRPMAVLFLSVTHGIPDDETVRSMLGAVREAIAPGSYLGFSQMCGTDLKQIEKSEQVAAEQKYTFRVRLPDEVAGFLHALEPVDPGLVYVRDWRADPAQPPLPPVDEPLQQYLDYPPGPGGIFGGLVRKP
jgi:hypothetical protein